MSHTWENGFNEGETAYYAAVGYLCHQWNNVEYFVYSLGTDVMHLERRFHRLLFRHLSIKSLQSFVEDYVASHYDEEILQQIKYVNRYVECCRINRNLIVHGFPGSDPETGDPLIRTAIDKNHKDAKTFPISIEAVRKTCDECEIAGFLLIRFQLLVDPDAGQHLMEKRFGPDPRKALLAKPPLPKSLALSPHNTPAQRSPPQSSGV